MNTAETKQLIGESVKRVWGLRAGRPSILIQLFGKSYAQLTDAERIRYRQLGRNTTYYRRFAQNRAKQRKHTANSKLDILEVLGWPAACAKCGYDRCLAALEFNHLDPTQKDGPVRTVEEARKCELLCANCHREHHYANRTAWKAASERRRGPADPLLEPYMRAVGCSEEQIAAALAGRPRCDCHRHEHQVCDICQHVTGNEKDSVGRLGDGTVCEEAMPAVRLVGTMGAVRMRPAFHLTDD